MKQKFTVAELSSRQDRLGGDSRWQAVKTMLAIYRCAPILIALAFTAWMFDGQDPGHFAPKIATLDDVATPEA